MMTRHLMVALACSMIGIAGAGCTGTNDGSRPLDTATVQQQPDDISGSYALVAVDGAKIPATVSHGNATIKVHSGVFEIRADGTCSSKIVFNPPSSGKITQMSHATWTRKDSSLIMRWEGAGMTTGAVDGERFTMDNHGMVFEYARSGQVDDTFELAQPGACDESDANKAIERARSGVFDDFNSGLKTGRDQDGIPIGFFTFRDSPESKVGISTTSDHPPLPGESGSNEVLRLNLDVKAWGGVIHHFENAAVNRWTPRDWRGFDGFSFWLYGNNDNTGLFVEILDNRNPCPTPGPAEIHTYLFTDNFTGWKQITVPFEKLTRKEIGNGSPNDGLGLSEVHGWAFGTLKTGASTTYYIDDFELR